MKLLEFAELLETTDKVQCFGQLISQDGKQCCALGVAANRIYPDLNTLTQGVYDNTELCDLEDDCGDVTGHSVLQLNDRKKLSFKKIANLIRENLKRKTK